jgi:hypothetical protein
LVFKVEGWRPERLWRRRQTGAARPTPPPWTDGLTTGSTVPLWRCARTDGQRNGRGQADGQADRQPPLEQLRGHAPSAPLMAQMSSPSACWRKVRTPNSRARASILPWPSPTQDAPRSKSKVECCPSAPPTSSLCVNARPPTRARASRTTTRKPVRHH